MPEKRKANELCAAIEVRGWANTKLSRGKDEAIILNSKTGCRSWKGTQWGMIAGGAPGRLDVVIDVPRGRLNEASVAERLNLPVVDETDEISGVRIEPFNDRDKLHIYLCDDELHEAKFRNSPIVELIADVRRWACL
ncbi:hypothetical protein B0H94_103224 [Salsuginibacillus halophilus]|uniref:Uncharacterized protein n=1 Tax=Salsuginibacillus halophilus TaxID=517424 RepID=A0A2P8HWK0_9BACI|nr:hypothetical protein [Salsuginibacillus halophilus]PSL50611.1 hypothetical protein B0H94_103224 [Salsuginibacillus halophilus]